MIRRIRIRAHQLGLVFRDGAFSRILESGRHWIFDPSMRTRVEVVSTRDVIFTHEQIDKIADSGLLKERAIALDLRDYQRALVWIDGRFDQILPAGSYALWTTHRQVRVEIVDARNTRFQHDEFAVITRRKGIDATLDICDVNRDKQGVLFVDGCYVDTLSAGRYAFWKGLAVTRVIEIDTREQALDVSGQELMTSDKVTLRLNAVLTFRVTNPRRSVRPVTTSVKRCIALPRWRSVKSSDNMTWTRFLATRMRWPIKCISNLSLGRPSWVLRLSSWEFATSSCQAT